MNAWFDKRTKLIQFYLIFISISTLIKQKWQLFLLITNIKIVRVYIKQQTVSKKLIFEMYSVSEKLISFCNLIIWQILVQMISDSNNV